MPALRRLLRSLIVWLICCSGLRCFAQRRRRYAGNFRVPRWPSRHARALPLVQLRLQKALSRYGSVMLVTLLERTLKGMGLPLPGGRGMYSRVRSAGSMDVQYTACTCVSGRRGARQAGQARTQGGILRPKASRQVPPVPLLQCSAQVPLQLKRSSGELVAPAAQLPLPAPGVPGRPQCSSVPGGTLRVEARPPLTPVEDLSPLPLPRPVAPTAARRPVRCRLSCRVATS